MKLNKITIENYRSIQKIDLEIESIAGKKCMILLGINESGKSNILKAINLEGCGGNIDSHKNCNQEAESTSEDMLIGYRSSILKAANLGVCVGNIDYHKNCNQEAESESKSISIGYNYTSAKWVDELKSRGIPGSLAKIIKVEKINRIVVLDAKSKYDIFCIQIEDNADFQKYALFRNFSGETKLRVKNNIRLNEDEEIDSLDKASLEKYLESNIYPDLSEHNIPKVIFWKAEDKYLLNKPIDLNGFKQDTSISIPLRNCFNIAGIEQNDIEKAVNAIVGNSAKKLKLQNKLSNKVTEYINTVWAEHKIKISFDIDNMQLSFLVAEQDDSDVTVDVSQRSDGFKQFISILLNLSIENKTGKLKNKIILLDEPEIHLHPSGQKYLRDELLKISENNVVIYATHSIYMVDKNHIDRHYHVQKENGLTTVKQIEANNPYGDEVLYSALGTSILEHVEPNVLIVEGKTDRDIFNLYCNKFPEVKPPRISVISADGAKNIIKYTKFFNTNVIKGFALFDSDTEGKSGKKQVIETENYTKDNTFEINDILGTEKECALEDLFDKKYLEDLVEGVVVTLNGEKILIKQLKDACLKNKVGWYEEKVKKYFMQKIAKLSKEQLKKEKYYKFFEGLILKIN